MSNENEPQPEQNPEPSREEMLKSHLALAAQMVGAICEANDVDLDGTNITTTVGEQSTSLSLRKMLAQWKELTK